MTTRIRTRGGSNLGANATVVLKRGDLMLGHNDRFQQFASRPHHSLAKTCPVSLICDLLDTSPTVHRFPVLCSPASLLCLKLELFALQCRNASARQTVVFRVDGTDGAEGTGTFGQRTVPWAQRAPAPGPGSRETGFSRGISAMIRRIASGRAFKGRAALACNRLALSARTAGASR